MSESVKSCAHLEKGRCELAEEIAERAADKAAKKTLSLFGVDIEKADQVKQFQQDIWFAGEMRGAAKKGFLAMVAAVAVALTAALWLGIKMKIGG